MLRLPAVLTVEGTERAVTRKVKMRNGACNERGSMSNVIKSRLASLMIVLPPAPTPQANYVPFVISGNFLFLSGQGPKALNGTWLCGKVGEDVSVDVAYQHARLTGMSLLATATAALGTLDRVQRVVKLLGLVNATPSFGDHPKVINGCSDLMVEVFGDLGRHARSAIGVGSLPGGITVEIEAILEFR